MHCPSWLTGLIAAAILCCFTTACITNITNDEVARAPSPDGRVDAVIFESNGGATTLFGYQVELRERSFWRRSEDVAYLYGATRNESAWGVNVRWLNDREVRVEYLDAKKVWLNKPNIRLAGREITVVLQAGVEDRTAPAGGMLDNLERGRRSR